MILSYFKHQAGRKAGRKAGGQECRQADRQTEVMQDRCSNTQTDKQK